MSSERGALEHVLGIEDGGDVVGRKSLNAGHWIFSSRQRIESHVGGGGRGSLRLSTEKQE